MRTTYKNITALVDVIKIDRFDVICYFRCKITNKSVVATVPFEPFKGKIEIIWYDILLHPIRSYNKFYHTPIKIYSKDTHETILLKAFEKVSSKFKWSSQYNQYISA